MPNIPRKRRLRQVLALWPEMEEKGLTNDQQDELFAECLWADRGKYRMKQELSIMCSRFEFTKKFVKAMLVEREFVIHLIPALDYDSYADNPLWVYLQKLRNDFESELTGRSE